MSPYHIQPLTQPVIQDLLVAFAAESKKATQSSKPSEAVT